MRHGETTDGSSLTIVNDREITVREELKAENVSRRGVFRLFGLAIASTIAVPAALLTVTDAEARVGNPGSAVSVAGANRRDRRDDRRYKKKKRSSSFHICQ